MTNAVPPAALFFRNSRRNITAEDDTSAPPENTTQSVRTGQMTGLGQIFGSHRESPNSLPGRGENRVEHGGSDHRQSGLADSSRFFLAHDHVNCRFRSLVH